MEEQDYLAEPMAYDAERLKLARRRRIAEALIRTEAPGMVGTSGITAMSGPLGGVGAALSRGAGQYDLNRLDEQDKLLGQQEVGQNRRLLQANGLDPDLATANKDIRGLIEKQLALKSAQEERGAQLAADREWKTQEAELNRIERGEQQAADRVAREDLRRMPTTHVTVNSGGGGSNSFGGTATQIGIDPRTEAPVYRHSKSSQLFRYDEHGQPVAHEGAIAPKPAAAKEPTESERSSAGYLGRMEATEKNLGNAKPFSLPVQTGLDRAPNVTNFVLSPEQQVQRQQQEDWVRAKLRKESGAVIGDQEMAREIRTYFPMAGDSDKVILQKRQSRMQAIEQMKSSAGRSKPTEAAPVAPTVVRTGTRNGVKIQQMSDGSIREVK